MQQRDARLRLRDLDAHEVIAMTRGTARRIGIAGRRTEFVEETER
jgi:hypothetical protein